VRKKERKVAAFFFACGKLLSISARSTPAEVKKSDVKGEGESLPLKNDPLSTFTIPCTKEEDAKEQCLPSLRYD